jgi:RNA polymerase sigma-70 factor (ECF subfamily)
MTIRATTTATTAAITAEVATASSPHEARHARGRPDEGTAAARTERLFADYGRTVAGLCRALLRDQTEVEDATQQTFLSAHRALLNGTDPREPAAWLATIARNECWARIRSRMREPLPADGIEAVSTTNDPLTEAIRRADLRALWAAIEELPRPQRDALLLREFGGLTYAELATALAVSGPAVESLLFRARHRLRVQLRAVYASISGASWIETLVRLFAGGGAPVAAKVAALSVGAVALSGTAVVVPHAFDNHRPARGPVLEPARIPVRVHATVHPKTVAPVAAFVDHPVPVAPVAKSHGRMVERRDTSGDHQGGGQSSDAAVSRAGGGDHRGEDGSQAATAVPLPTTPSSTDGDHGGGEASGDGGDGGGHDGSGPDGGGGSD